MLGSIFQSRRSLHWIQGFLLLASLCLLFFLIQAYHVGDAMERLEQNLLDMRLKARAEQLTPDPNIVIVATDYETARYTRNHPELGISNTILPRKRVAQIIRYAKEQGAKAILLDVEFKTPSTPEDDQALEQAIREAGNVYLAMSVDGSLAYWLDQKKAQVPTLVSSPKLRKAFTHACLVEKYQQDFMAAPQFLALFKNQGLPVSYTIPPPLPIEDSFTYCQTSGILERFLKVAKGVGIVRVDYDSDAFIRDVPVLYRSYQGTFHTYLGIRAAWDLLQQPSLHYSPEALQAGPHRIPLHQGNHLLINWRAPTASAEMTQRLGGGHLYRKISAIDILRASEAKSGAQTSLPSLYNSPDQPETGILSLKDKILIYGDTIKDIHRTPVGTAIFGPEIVATVLDMLLHDDRFIQKAETGPIVILMFLFISGILWAILRFPRLTLGFGAGCLILALYTVFNFTVFINHGLWLPLVLPSILLFLTLMGGTTYKYYVHDREKHQLAHAFSNYVSPQIMNEILKDPHRAMDNLKGSKKELTVLFADIKNFTPLFEHEDPELMVEQLNDYLDTMVTILLKHGGTIDKYMGDSVMAFFGAPYPLANHAQKACEAALDMQAALTVLNQKWEATGKKALSHGIGISTGLMFVGNFGSQKIKDFTVMGSLVNLGSRLENHTREVDADIIISEATYQAVAQQARVHNLGQISIKGFRESVQVYGLEGL